MPPQSADFGKIQGQALLWGCELGYMGPVQRLIALKADFYPQSNRSHSGIPPQSAAFGGFPKIIALQQHQELKLFVSCSLLMHKSSGSKAATS